MSQTYPAVLPSTLKVTDGTALYNPAVAAYADGNVNTTVTFEPSQHSEKASANGVGAICTLVSKACNMPY